MIRDFARHIVVLDATSGGNPVLVQKLDKCSWQAPAGLSELSIQYDVYAWDLSVRSAHLDTQHGFFNGTSVFLAVNGQENSICTVTINPPSSSLTRGWKVATALPAVAIDGDGFGDYKALDYDELIDHPVELGTFERALFSACGVEHELVLTGRYNTDIERICGDLSRICEHQIRFFGEPAPVERYVFLVMVVGDGYGGLEHRASTSLLCKRSHLPVPGDRDVSDDYLEFLGLCSHEYFHTWNVKRIKPARFVPYELAAESYTELLWVFEGITSYYDDLFLLRCGLIDTPRYLTLLARTITRVYRGAGRLKQSVAESSFDAWTRFYQQDENAPNAIVSYYAKGALIALSLDALIRQESAGKHTLDDFMRALWQAYLADPTGVTEASIERLAGKLCGKNVAGFFQQAVFGTDDLPLEQSFAVLGLEAHWRGAESQEDRGGTAAKESRPVLNLGVRIAADPAGVKLTHVFDDGPAQRAGLSAGDTLVAVERLAVTAVSLADQLKRREVGNQLEVHVFRRDELLQLTVTLTPPAADTCSLSVADDDKVATWIGA